MLFQKLFQSEETAILKKLSLESRKEQKTVDKNLNIRTSNLGTREVKIVKGENQLLRALTNDWDLIRELSNQRFIIQKLCD